MNNNKKFLTELYKKEQKTVKFDYNKIEYDNYSKLDTIINDLITLRRISSIIIDDKESYEKLKELYTKYKNIFDDKEKIIINSFLIILNFNLFYAVLSI